MKIGDRVKVNKEKFTEFRKNIKGDIPKFSKKGDYMNTIIPEEFEITYINNGMATWGHYSMNIYVPVEFLIDIQKLREEKLNQLGIHI